MTPAHLVSCVHGEEPCLGNLELFFFFPLETHLPKAQRWPLRVTFGPSLRPPQGTWGSMTKPTHELPSALSPIFSKNAASKPSHPFSSGRHCYYHDQPKQTNKTALCPSYISWNYSLFKYLEKMVQHKTVSEDMQKHERLVENSMLKLQWTLKISKSCCGLFSFIPPWQSMLSLVTWFKPSTQFILINWVINLIQYRCTQLFQMLSGL